jgi:hypothetical protein
MTPEPTAKGIGNFGSDAPRCIRVVMNVYVDDGHTMDGAHMCLAGYSGTYGAMGDLADEWLKLSGDLPGNSLHTSDFLSGKGQYKGWDVPYDGRIKLLQQFIEIINRHAVYGFVVTVDCAVLKEEAKGLEARIGVPKQYMEQFEKNAFCLSRVIGLNLHSRLKPDALSIICDSGKSAMHMYGAFDRLKSIPQYKNRLAAITFGDDRFMQPLQAADLLACVLVKDRGRRGHGARPIGLPTLQELFDTPGSRVTYDSEHWTRERIEQVFRNLAPPADSSSESGSGEGKSV